VTGVQTCALPIYYPTRPLDMEDDPENPKNKNLQPLKDRRTPQLLQQGQHEPIYPYDIWEANMQLRSAKGKTPTNSGRPRREYLLTGIARCWVCYEHAGKQAGFRGSTSRNDIQYYRCATLHDKSKRAGEEDALDTRHAQTVPIAEGSGQWDRLIDAHPTSTLHADEMEKQVHDLMKRFVIPQEWHDLIAAYYLSDHGMADFERESYNLRQELARFQDMYSSGYLTQAQFQERALLITRELQSMKVTGKPEAQQILPLLSDFGSVWEKAKAVEQRGLLKKMFLALYFDGEGMVSQALSNSPFDRLLLN
jgi:hypothetical protein